MIEIQKPNGGTSAKVGDQAASERAKNIGQDIKAKASEFTDDVSRVVKEQASDISSAAKEIAGDATERLKSAVNEQKSASADYLGSVAHAVERAAEGFENDVPQAAKYIRQAAEQIESVADAVRQRDLTQLVGEVEHFARRQPTLFFGGAVILGFAAIRFFKSASSTSRSKSAYDQENKSSPHGSNGTQGSVVSSYNAQSKPSGKSIGSFERY